MTRGYSRSEHTKQWLAEVHRRRANNYTGLSCRHNPIYRIYSVMVQRCVNPKSRGYCDYGGRGIKICDRWLEKEGKGFKNFVDDLGPRPEGKYSRTGHSVYRLSRRDTKGHFCPENCCWATYNKSALQKGSQVVAVPSTFNQPNEDLPERQRMAWKLSERFGWVCWYCGIRLNVIDSQSRRAKPEHVSMIVRPLEVHLDHIIPRIAGGTDDISNRALSCECCNRAKMNLNVDFFLEWLDRVKFGDSWCPFRDGRRSRLGT
jgi:hypothetical protein